MRKVISCITIIGLLLGLSACGTDKLVGKWDVKGMNGNVFVFYEDGTYSVEYYTTTEDMGEYKKIGSDKVELLSEDTGSTIAMTYYLDETNKTIEIKDFVEED